MSIGATLPDWVDTDFLKSASAVLAFACAGAIIAVFVLVRSVVTKLVLTCLLLGGLVGFFAYREEIDDCAADCSCSLFGEQVHIDNCADEPH